MQQDLLPELHPSAAFNPAQAMGCFTDVTEIAPVSPAAGSARQPADHLGPKQQGTLQAPPLPAPDAAHTSSDQTATLSTHYAGTGSRGECDQHLQLQQLAGADAAALVIHCAAGGCCTAAVQRECSPPDAAAGAAPYASWAGCGTAGQGQSSSPASSSQEALWHNQQHCDPQEPYHQFHDRQQQWQRQHSPLHLQQQGVLPVSAAQQQQQQLEGLVHGQQKQDHEQDLGREDQQQYHQQQQQLRELLQLLQASCNQHQRQEHQQPELPRPVEEAGAPGGATGPHCVHHQQQQEPPQQQPRQQQQRQQQQQSPQPQPPSSHDSEALLVGDTSADTTQGQQDQQLPPASATAAAVAAVVEYVAVAIRSAQARAAEEYNAEEQQQSGEQAATPPAAASATASASAAVVVNADVLGPAAAGAEDSGTAAAAAAADSQGQQQSDVSAAAAAADCEDTAAQGDALEEEEAAAAAAEVCSEDAECSVDEGSAPSDPLDRLLQLAEVAAQQFGVPADAAAAAGGDTAAPRWVANNEIWTSEDGLTVWPKDSPITPTPRVFYLTFKWVADHWPGPAAEATGTSSTHVTSTTAELYLDGEACRITMPAKIRLYSRAVHLVLSPYSKLSKAFPRKWLAGYAYDSKRDRLRLYLSTLKPRPPQLPAEPKPPKAPKPKAAAAAGGGSNGDPAGSSKQAVRKRKRSEPLQPPSQHPGLPPTVMGMLQPLMPLPMRPRRGSGGGVVSITWGKASARGTQAPPPAMAVAPPVLLVRPQPCGPGGPLPIPTAAAGSAAGGGGGSASGPVLHQMPPSASQQWLQQQQQQQMRQQQLWRQQQQQYQQQLGVQRVPAGQTQPAPMQHRSDQQRVVPRQIVFLQQTQQLRPALPPQWQQVMMAQQQPQAAVLQRQLQQQQQLFPPCMQQQQQQVVVPRPPPQHHQQQQAGLVQLLQLPVAMRQPQHHSLHHQQQQQMALSTVGEQQHKVPAEQPPPPQPVVVQAEGPTTS